jgi:endonuclease-3
MVRPRSPKGRTRETSARLAIEYPGTAKELCALQHDNPFQLLIATILSAQSTDARVNMVTPALFARYPNPEDLAAADPAEVEQLVASTGFFRAKTRSLIGMAQGLVARYQGDVPVAIEDLTTLPGVGRKTANVIRSVDFDAPGLPVDTHVLRLSRLLGLTTNKDPEKVEADLTAMLAPKEWGALSLRMILHGRRVCIARRPRCEECVLADFCPSARVPTVVRGT